MENIVNIFYTKTAAFDFIVYSFLFQTTSIFDIIKYTYLTDSILIISTAQLFNSVILDQLILNELVEKNFFLNTWYKSAFSNSTNYINLFITFHPEFCFVKDNYSNKFLLKDYLTKLNYINSESFLSPSVQLIDLLFFFFFLTLTIVIFVSFYSKASSSYLIDASFLSTSSLIESEKEIGSFDDILLSLLIVVYVFGWFFYIHIWTILGSYPELILFIYLLPILAYLIFGVPTILLIDFGIYFLMFIRGCASSTSIIVELMYDYINFGAFYVRLSVQWVRLLIMYLTFIVMHDTIFFCNIQITFFVSFFDYIFETSYLIINSIKTITYTFLASFYITFFRLLFELVHTLFVCTAQFLAFFAISFWFFSFLYTFFTLIKFENHFLNLKYFK